MKKIAKACAIALAVILAALAARNLLPPLLMRRATYGMTALTERKSVGTLYMGSSMFGKGLNPRLLEEDSWILAYNGTQPVLEEWMLEHLLKKGLQIDRLVVDLYAYSAASEPSLSDDRLFLDLTLSEKISLMGRVYGGKAPLSLWREALVSGNNESLLAWPVYSRLVNANYLRGGRLQDFEGSTAKALKKAGVYGIGKTLNGAQEQALQGIAALCRKNGIELIFAETPKYKLTMQDAGYCRVMEMLHTLADECGVRVIQADAFADISKDASCFVDPIHLSARGRDLFTRGLLELLGE